MANTFPPPDKLDLEGDNATVALRWEKWFRSLKFYLEATGIENSVKKRAILLVLGGPPLQDIIHNLPGALVEPADGIDVFKTAVEKLDNYFLPKQNKIFDRHLFRQIKQNEGEKFEKFVINLRNQADKCKFTCAEEHLIDQIVEKCASNELRKKVLTIGDSVTLDKIITEANTLEVVGQQLDGYGQKDKTSEINEIRTKLRSDDATKKKTEFVRKGGSTSQTNFKKCGRCGYSAHANNQECPAKKKQCHSCGKLGHFKIACRTHPRKRPLEHQKEGNNRVRISKTKQLGWGKNDSKANSTKQVNW